MLNVVIGALELLISPIGGLAWFKKRALGGGKKLAKAAGRLAGMVGAMPTPYRNVVGN